MRILLIEVEKILKSLANKMRATPARLLTCVYVLHRLQVPLEEKKDIQEKNQGLYYSQSF